MSMCEFGNLPKGKTNEQIKIEKLEHMLRDAVESLIVSCQLLECSENVIDKHHAKQNLEHWIPIWKETRRL